MILLHDSSSRDKAELYLPELYNKIGVGLMAWSPGLIEATSGDRFAISKSSFTKKSQSYTSWTEDEANKEASDEISNKMTPKLTHQSNFCIPGRRLIACG